MNWTDLLESEIEDAYRAAEGLMNQIERDDDLAWKPATGDNWMTTGQLLRHIADACGGPCKGFVRGDWDMPEGVDPENMPEDAMFPPAEEMPSVESVEEAREMLAADKRLALELIDEAADRMDEPVGAPWDPTPRPLGQHLLGMVGHLNGHKGQLFYYLKLQGKPVNTMHYFGMV